MKVSAVLITKEPEYPKLVLERIQTGFFDEVLIGTKSPSVYRRYQIAGQAKNDIIYFQDDDCFTNYQMLFKQYNGQITNSMTKSFQDFYEPLGCTLMGWGSFFPKEMLRVFDRYIQVHDDDEHLLREADRIFTYLNKPFNTVIMPHQDLPQTSDRMSSPKNVDFHFKSMHEALRKCSLL
jgi:hypothetical protein